MGDIVFLARGHGFGHAARDLRIMRGLQALRPGSSIVLASSGTGFAYFNSRGIPCEDLGIPDRHDQTEAAARRVWQFLQSVRNPDLVIADEVVWALPFCRRYLGCPRVLLTDWLYADFGVPKYDPFLNAASEIIVLDFDGAHPGPYRITAPVRFTGPVIELFAGERLAAREQLGVPGEGRVTVLTVGGRTDRPDIRDIVIHVVAAWSATAKAHDTLFVLGGLPDPVSDVPATVRQILYTASPEVYYRAADLVITDARGMTSFEIAANGIPVVPVLTGQADRGGLAGRRMALLEAAQLAVTARIDDGQKRLCDAIASARDLPRRRALPPEELPWATGLDIAARLLARVIT